MLGKWIRVYCSKKWGWLADSGSESRSYFYGYPADGTVEPNVIAQWLFDEASGSIVDEVTALTLSVTGSPTFGVQAIGSYANLDKGITYSSGQRHSTSSGGAASPGVNDFTYECWFSTTEVIASENIVISTRNSIAEQTMYISLRGAIRMCTFFYIEPGVAQQAILLEIPSGINITDGGLHHFRIAGDRDGSLEMFMDGVSMGSTVMSPGLTGATLASDTLYIGNYTESDLPLNGTLYELRISSNNTNNSRIYDGP